MWLTIFKMSKYILILVSILMRCFCSEAQNSFIKTFDFGPIDNAYQILKYNNRNFISCASWCGVECSYISEVDLNGNILWRTELPDIDIAQGTMVIVNDTITITGNNDVTNSAFRMAHFTLEGLKIGETIEIDHPIEKFTNMFQLTTQFYSDNYILCGTGRKDNIRYSLMYVVNKNGYIDSLIKIEPSNKMSSLWESFIDGAGNLTTFHWMQKNELDSNYRVINKFDQNFNKVWSYQSEDNDINFTVPRACELNDGRIVIAYTNPIGGFYLHSVRTLNPDGSLDWQYDYEWYGSRTREISRLKKLRNGDIMGSGRYSELEQIPRIGDSPWLFRMSPEGELLWEHIYYEVDSTLGEFGNSREGTLLDFVEMDNGDIMAVGNFRYNDKDMLIMRVDSNGCLDPNYCHETNLLTAIPDISPKIINDILIIPNPAQEKISIEFDTPMYQLEVEIIDMSGQKVAISSMINGHVDMGTFTLPKGLYLVNVKQGGQIVATGKFVKSE